MAFEKGFHALIGAAALAALAQVACGAHRPPCAERAPEAQAFFPRERIEEALSQSLRILVLENGAAVKSGSGVVLATEPAEGSVQGHARNFVMTNAHVVAPLPGEKLHYRVIVEGAPPDSEPRQFDAHLVALGEVPEIDLALLQIDGPALDPVQLASDDELTIGTEVFAVVAPYGRALSVTGGLVSQIDYSVARDADAKASSAPTGEPLQARPRMLKTDAAIGYGASGGGLFSRRSGHLLGIIEGYRTAKVTFPIGGEVYAFDIPMPGETFAAPVEKVRRFLRANGFAGLLDGNGAQAP